MGKIEQELKSLYSDMLSVVIGMPPDMALFIVGDIIKKCKQDLIKWGYKCEESGLKTSKALINKVNKKKAAIYRLLVKDLVRDVDIIDWWDRPMLEIEVEKRFDAVLKMNIVMNLAMDEGITQEDAYKKFLRLNPIFSNSKVSSPLTPKSPLPWELKKRVHRSGIFILDDSTVKKIFQFSSCNAWIRNKIRLKEI